MRNFLVSLLVGVLTTQSILLAETLESQKKSLEETLNQRFKYDNIKSIKEMHEKELEVLETQYARNKQIEDFQKRQKPDVIRMPIYTNPFVFVSSDEWEEEIVEYANQISVTKIPRRDSVELIFHFPELDSKINRIMETYRIQPPTIKVASILLASGKVLPIDQVISSRAREQSIIVETEGDSILKINLTMDYQIPNKNNVRTILSTDTPKINDITLLPSYSNIVLLKLNEDKAKSIIHIDAEDKNGNTLASRGTEKLVNINDLSIQAARIDLLRGLLKAIEEGKIKFPKDATEYLVNNSDKHLEFLSNQTRELTKVFTGEIARVIIYTAEKPDDKQLSFSIY